MWIAKPEQFRWMWLLARGVVATAGLLFGAPVFADASGEDSNRISDEVVPLATDEIPDRPWPTLELGAPFLGPGDLGFEFELPTGAVIRPSLLLFGQLRTALQTYDSGRETVSELPGRLDLFANLQLTGTERILFGVRPLDQDGKFTEWEWDSGGENFTWEINGRVTTFFFEGDLGEIFPKLDPEDRRRLDYGFAVGRQPLLLQNGLLANDNTLEAVGITRNSLLPKNVANLLVTAYYCWGHLDRADARRDGSANLFGLFSEADFRFSTLNLELLYVDSTTGRGDAIYVGASAVQRLGPINTSFRVTSSIPTGQETAVSQSGTLLFSEVSWTPPHGHDLLYLNTFWGIDDYLLAARSPDVGGPLGRVGILFAAVGLGRYGSALSNDARNVVGASLGYQMFLGGIRRQLIFELGGRQDTNNNDTAAIAAGVRFQQAIGQHHILQLDGFVGEKDDGGTTAGARCEWRIKF